MRTWASAGERGRARASAEQMLLPIGAVEQSDAAYLAALDSAGLPEAVAAIVRWLIRDGQRVTGEKQLPARPQRALASRLGLSPSTVCGALARLKDSGLVVQADGVFRLRLGLLVAIAEEAESRRQSAALVNDPAAALDRLQAGRVVRARSACSGALGAAPVSVEEIRTYPESVSAPESVSGRAAVDRPLPSATQAGPRDGSLKGDGAWRALQTEHFRPRLDAAALLACFRAAVVADLLDWTAEHAVRFGASAWDLARSEAVRKPAAALRTRVEREACWRFSPEGAAWANQQLVPLVAGQLAPARCSTASVGGQAAAVGRGSIAIRESGRGLAREIVRRGRREGWDESRIHAALADAGVTWEGELVRC